MKPTLCLKPFFMEKGNLYQHWICFPLQGPENIFDLFAKGDSVSQVEREPADQDTAAVPHGTN